MSFPEYPNYQDSGVQWLGEVPSHWSIGRLKHLLRIRGGQDYKAVESEEPTEFPVIGSGGPFTYATDYLYNGESVLLGRKGTIDKPLYVRGKFWTVDTMFYTEVLPGNNGRYAYYLATTIPFGLYSTNTALPSMSQFDLANHEFPLPGLAEQTQIARFLDHETAKIDALIHEQERLIELLQEKRQAVISHAVTKGLDPDVPMKDSGVEWLGEVPAHWEVKRIKHAVISIEQGWSPQCDNSAVQSNEEFGVLKVGCVNRGLFRSDENKRLPADIAPKPELSVKADDLLVSRANTRYLVGNAAVPTIDYPNLMISDKLYRLRLDPSLAIPHYVSFFLGTPLARHEIELDASGASSSMLNIGQKTILEMPFPCPPVSEQVQIRDEIVKQTYQLLALSQQAVNLMSYLQERRSALISAAVTGKIDVRDWQPPADESAYDEEVCQTCMEATV